jgi:ABC-2 type transport system ATP-binding protein
MLSGLMSPDSGQVEIFGKDFFKNEEEIKARFNVATAYYGFNHRLTVLQNLRVYSKLYNVKNYEKKIKELTEKFAITKLLNTQMRKLSTGETTRAVLAKALLNDPELLFLDECTVGLDPNMAEITRDILKMYNKENQCTVLFTSHYMQEVEQLCDRIAFMNNGKIVKIGTARDLVKELERQKVTLHFSRNKDKAKKILKQMGLDFEDKKGLIEFHIKNRKRVIYPILEKLVKNKVVFDHIHLEKPTLEEYFIKQSRKF